MEDIKSGDHPPPLGAGSWGLGAALDGTLEWLDRVRRCGGGGGLQTSWPPGQKRAGPVQGVIWRNFAATLVSCFNFRVLISGHPTGPRLSWRETHCLPVRSGAKKRFRWGGPSWGNTNHALTFPVEAGRTILFQVRLSKCAKASAIIAGAVVVIAILARNPVRHWFKSLTPPEPSQGHIRGCEGVAVDSDGTVYVADQRAGRISMFERDGGLLSQFDTVEGYTDGEGRPSHITRGLYMIAPAPRQLVIVANHNVAELDLRGDVPKLVRIIGSRGSGPGQMNGPEGIARDTNGDLYVTDEHNRRINVFDKEGRYLRSIPVPQDPQCVFVWKDRIYVSLNKRNYIACYSKDGVEKFRIGSEAAFPAILWGTGTASVLSLAVFALPRRKKWPSFIPLAILAAGGLGCLADFIHHHRPGQFRVPDSMCVSPDGKSLYVSDRWNHRVQVFDPDGNYKFHFGRFGARLGRFREPRQIAFDPEGRVLVADRENNRVQVFTPEGRPIRAIQ